MAKLRRAADGAEHVFGARLLVGRSPGCGLRLSDPYVSLEHATLRWTGDGFEVRDLGSRNGTFVHGVRIPPSEATRIDVGSDVAFGNLDDTFELTDARAPELAAVDLDSGSFLEGRDGLLVLPDFESPLFSIYRDARGAFSIESADGEVREAREGEELSGGGRRWRLELPLAAEGTPLFDHSASLSSVSFRFFVSSDEERVEIKLERRGRLLSFEPREHGYLLLTLARLRKADAHLPVEQRGWIDRDRLLKMLRIDSNSLNVAIHRARQQLLEAGVAGAAGIVEVRRGLRRFGTDRVEVLPLE